VSALTYKKTKKPTAFLYFIQRRRAPARGTGEGEICGAPVQVPVPAFAFFPLRFQIIKSRTRTCHGLRFPSWLCLRMRAVCCRCRCRSTVPRYGLPRRARRACRWSRNGLSALGGLRVGAQTDALHTAHGTPALALPHPSCIAHRAWRWWYSAPSHCCQPHTFSTHILGV
jgi:hypothetical protein